MAIKQMEKGKKLAEQNRMATMRAIDDRRRMQQGWQKREQIKPGAEAIGKKPDCQKSECKSQKGKEKK